MRSRRSALLSAILWTVIFLVWAVSIVARYNDPNTVGDSLVLTIFTALLSLALSVVFWVRFARHEKKQ